MTNYASFEIDVSHKYKIYRWCCQKNCIFL